MDAGIVIIGAGQAACQFVASVRQAGYQGGLTMVGAEAHAPYQRPPLSKGCIHGETQLDEISLRPASFYTAQRCHLVLGRAAEAVDAVQKTVQLDNGLKLSYDSLVLATGARARHWPGLPESAEHVYSLRSWDDARALRRHLSKASRLAVLGAGYVGLEVAASASRLGLRVEVFESAPRVMQRSVSSPTSSLIERLHEAHGVRVHLNSRIAGVALKPTPEDMVVVETAVGQFPADALVVGIGAQPCIDLAMTAGLVCDHAVRVDASCRTSDPSIYAIGDCAEQHVAGEAAPMRLESVQNAIDQAKCAAAALSGKPLPPATVPWFWSDQFDCRIHVAGRPLAGDLPVVRAYPDKPFAQAVWYLRDERVVAVEAVDATEDFMAARQLIRSGQRVNPALLADISVTLRGVAAAA